MSHMNNISNKNLAEIFLGYKPEGLFHTTSFYQNHYLDEISNNKEAIFLIIDSLLLKAANHIDSKTIEQLKNLTSFGFFKSKNNRNEVAHYILSKLNDWKKKPLGYSDALEFLDLHLFQTEQSVKEQHKKILSSIKNATPSGALDHYFEELIKAVQSSSFEIDEHLPQKPSLSGDIVNDYLSLLKEPKLDIENQLSFFADEINKLCKKTISNSKSEIKTLLNKALSTILIVNSLDLMNKDSIIYAFWFSIGAQNIIRIFSTRYFESMLGFVNKDCYKFPFHKEVLLSIESIKTEPTTYFNFSKKVKLTFDEFKAMPKKSMDALKSIPSGISTIKDVETVLNLLIDRFIENEMIASNTKKPYLDFLIPLLHENTRDITGASRLILESIMTLEENPNINTTNSLGFILGQIVYETDLKIDKDILNRIACHYKEDTRMHCLFYPNLPKETEGLLRSSRHYFMHDKSQSKHFEHLSKNAKSYDLINTLKNAFNVFHDQYGYPFDLFKNMTSKADICKLLFNSKHKHEVSFLFDSGRAESLTSISSLQTCFTNNKGKLDRHSYLSMLDRINTAVALFSKEGAAKHAGLAIGANSLKFAFSFYSFNEMMFIINNNPLDEARDIFRMTHSLCEHDDPEVAKKQTKLIRKWIDKEQSLSYSFHKYLSGKVSRDLGIILDEVTFYQTTNNFNQDDLNLNERLPSEIKIWLPQTGKELRRLGREQHHCVGSKFYVDACSHGHSIIFAITPNNDRTKTITVETTLNGKVKQMQGHCSRTISALMKAVAEDAGVAIADFLSKEKSGQTQRAA